MSLSKSEQQVMRITFYRPHRTGGRSPRYLYTNGLAAATQAAPQPVFAPPAPRLAHRWIITRGIDLAFIIGSALAGYAYLVANVALHVPISLLWWFWSVGFDGTHIFGTASRTFFDSEARHSGRALLFGSAAFFFALGPVLVLLGGKAVLALIVAVWAYYHVVRQHYGFMVLYKVKNRDLAKLDNSLDRWFLGVMTVFPPFHRFFIHHPEELGLHFSFPRLEPFLWMLVRHRAGVFRPAVRAHPPRRSREPAEVSAVRRRDPAALADLRLHELDGRCADGYHRAQPAVSRADLVPQSQPLRRRILRRKSRPHPASGLAQPAELCAGGAGLQRALPRAGFPAWSGFRPGLRLLLRLRPDPLLSR